MADLLVADARLTWASPRHQDDGLLGWVRVVLDGGLALDGLSLRRTLNGRMVLAFPSRRDGAGRSHAYIRPVDNDVRVSFERQVFEALGVEEDWR